MSEIKANMLHEFAKDIADYGDASNTLFRVIKHQVKLDLDSYHVVITKLFETAKSQMIRTSGSEKIEQAQLSIISLVNDGQLGLSDIMNELDWENYDLCNKFEEWLLLKEIEHARVLETSDSYVYQATAVQAITSTIALLDDLKGYVKNDRLTIRTTINLINDKSSSINIKADTKDGRQVDCTLRQLPEVLLPFPSTTNVFNKSYLGQTKQLTSGEVIPIDYSAALLVYLGKVILNSGRISLDLDASEIINELDGGNSCHLFMGFDYSGLNSSDIFNNYEHIYQLAQLGSDELKTCLLMSIESSLINILADTDSEYLKQEIAYRCYQIFMAEEQHGSEFERYFDDMFISLRKIIEQPEARALIALRKEKLNCEQFAADIESHISVLNISEQVFEPISLPSNNI
jgi:hypothetical protein